MLTIMASLAHQESQSLSQNVKLGIQYRYQQGEVQVNHNRFLGYTKDENKHLIIDPEGAEIVKRIYREYLEGASLSRIAKGLEKDAILTAAGKLKWRSETLKKILQNEKYYGELLLQKTVTADYLIKKRVDNKNLEPMYRIENNHEPIISKEMFELVQQERKRRYEITKGENDDRRKYTNKYGFSGKLYCEKCGKTLKRRHWNSGTKSQKIVWQCNSYIEGKKNCSAKAVDDLILKRAFIQLYNDIVVDKGSFFKVFL